MTTKEKLEKELRRLQRDLNSPRLLTYILGDTSEEEQARQRERASKLARFNEILEVLQGKKMTLAEALEAALDGKATRQDVIAAIDAELAADPEPYSMVEGEGAGQYTFDTPKDSQLAMF